MMKKDLKHRKIYSPKPLKSKTKYFVMRIFVLAWFWAEKHECEVSPSVDGLCLSGLGISYL